MTLPGLAEPPHETLRRALVFEPSRLVAAAESIGHRVPPSPCAGVVRGASWRNVLIAAGGGLVTLAAADLGRGPATLRLKRMPALRLDRWFAPGEACVFATGRLTTTRVSIDFGQASTWQSPPPPLAAGDETLRLRLGALRDAAEPFTPSTWVLTSHCAACAIGAAVDAASAFIGLGDGSTPAGDDFLVGLLAGLGALAATSPLRQRFLASFGAAITTIAAPRTTALSAQYLRLAAEGDFDEPLARLRDLVVSAADERAIGAAAADALAVGASSGRAGVAGLVAGLEAWTAETDAR